MKKTFTIIIILISLSLVGIIILQLSWLSNMNQLSEDRIKQQVDDAKVNAGLELNQIKSSYVPIPLASGTNQFLEDFSRSFIKPQTLASKLSIKELHDIIRRNFNAKGLKKLQFDFAIINRNAKAYLPDEILLASNNFVASYSDSLNNYTPLGAYIISQPGSASESLTSNEILFVTVIDWKALVIRSLRWPIIMSIVFTLIIIAAFYVTVRTMLQQKKIGEIKNDFINNMTHEFKTPLATISLAVDALKNEKVLQNAEKIDYFRTIIKEENLRMNKQVETILKASQLEKQEVDLALSPLHVHDIIQDVVANFALQLEDKNGKAELNLQATNDLIEADEVHFGNLINNLVDNAVKYSKTNVAIHIKISSQNTGKKLVLRFEDNGIGMSKETVKRVFERFYRAHTGNLHNVKGFGLGLSYVKSMIEAHHGEIKVESTLGKGSIFTIELPLKK